MESARWWLLMLAAVMFSMSGCAAAWQSSPSAQHPAPPVFLGH